MEKLQDEITFTLNGQETRRVMTFGLLRKITAACPQNTIDPAAGLFFDHGTQEDVLGLVLSEYDEQGVMTKAVHIDEVNITPGTAKRILEWVEAHLEDFLSDAYARQIARAKRLTDAMGGMENLLSLQTGSPA